MTNEDAKRTLQDMWETLFNEMTNHTFEDLQEHGMLDNYSKAFNMAISALDESASIEKIRAEIQEKSVWERGQTYDGLCMALKIIDKEINKEDN